jgi:hypothetical protein
MIHGGAANEYEFIFTPDGPEEYPDLTRINPATARVGVAQHIASLGIPVLALSLPGHYSRKPWLPIAERRPEFVIGETPGDAELRNRLAVYTFRMCTEAIKTLVERSLPDQDIFMWGHSTGGEYFYLMEQHGLKNKLIGGLGFGTGMPAWVRKEWDLACAEKSAEERAAPFRNLTDLSRRSPGGYIKSGYVGPNQPWGSAENWFKLENHRRPQFKPFLQDIEHSAHDILLPEIRRISGLPDEELFAWAARKCSTWLATTIKVIGWRAARRAWSFAGRFMPSDVLLRTPRSYGLFTSPTSRTTGTSKVTMSDWQILW